VLHGVRQRSRELRPLGITSATTVISVEWSIHIVGGVDMRRHLLHIVAHIALDFLFDHSGLGTREPQEALRPLPVWIADRG